MGETVSINTASLYRPCVRYCYVSEMNFFYSRQPALAAAMFAFPWRHYLHILHLSSASRSTWKPVAR